MVDRARRRADRGRDPGHGGAGAVGHLAQGGVEDLVVGELRRAGHAPDYSTDVLERLHVLGHDRRREDFPPPIMTVIIGRDGRSGGRAQHPRAADRRRHRRVRQQGYDGTRLQDVARAAGLTTGAVYSNFRNKGELLFEAIGTRSATEIDDLLREVHGRDAPLDAARPRPAHRRARRRGPLLLDAVVAARRDPDLADHLRDRAEGREAWLAEVAREAQREGVVDAGGRSRCAWPASARPIALGTS